MVPIESVVLAQSGKNKHVNETGPANQKQAFKHCVIFPPNRSKQQDGERMVSKDFPNPNVYFRISQVTASMFRQDN